jgi:ATP-dependent Clp protease adapter protein ClpS
MKAVAYAAYPGDPAASKIEQVGRHFRQHPHPLQCVMEEA